MIKIYILIFSFILIGCGHDIQKDDIDNIGIGMNQEQVIDVLGNPDYKTTNREELSNEYYGWYSIHAVEAESEDSQYDEGAAYLSLNDYLEAIENRENVELFEYKVEDKFLVHVYFIDNKVNYFYEYEL